MCVYIHKYIDSPAGRVVKYSVDNGARRSPARTPHRVAGLSPQHEPRHGAQDAQSTSAGARLNSAEARLRVRECEVGGVGGWNWPVGAAVPGPGFDAAQKVVSALDAFTNHHATGRAKVQYLRQRKENPQSNG